MKIFEKFFTIFILFLTVWIYKINSYKSCEKEKLFIIGTKTYCETIDGDSTSCLTNPIGKALLRCEKGYFNYKNISEQEIECIDNGEWSEEPMKCVQKCDRSEKTLKLIDTTNNKTNIPVWYATVIRKYPIENKINIYPGIILSERSVLTRANSKEDFSNFKIQIQRSDNIMKEFNIVPEKIFPLENNNEPLENDYDLLENDNNDTMENDMPKLNSTDNEIFFILEIVHDYYIKYSTKIQPACRNLEAFRKLAGNAYASLFIIYLLPTVAILPTFMRECSIPSENVRTEVKCFEEKINDQAYAGAEVQCTNNVFGFITRCKVGYKNKNADSQDIVLSECTKSKRISLEKENCELICGEITPEYKPATAPLLYKAKPANIISAPWHVGVYANNTDISNTFEQICGGTIIHSNIILSAAHCFYDDANGRKQDSSNYIIGAGKRYRSYETTERRSHFARVESIGIPSNYQSDPQLNDIAIITLDHHLKYSTHIKPVCIDWDSNENFYIEEGIKGMLVGWGSTSNKRISSTELQSIELTTITNDHCKKLVDPNTRSEITGDKFCASNPQNGTACGGDSGGGLVVKKNIGFGDRYYLVGIVSVGLNVENYCSDGFITVFTNIRYYQDSIKVVISKIRNANVSLANLKVDDSGLFPFV